MKKVKVYCEENAIIPEYKTDGSAGCDLSYNGYENIIIYPGNRAVVPTGLFVEIPNGYEMQIRPRSGLTVSHGVTVLNSPGTIDSDYRGEVKVILINLGKEKFKVRKGDRIAQAVISKYEQASWKTVSMEDLDETTRNDGGFGSTGKN